MREIQASDAQAHLHQLLDDVERGEILVITRHGRPTARIVPEAHRRQELHYRTHRTAPSSTVQVGGAAIR